jgi:hypothetical protein
MKSIVFEVQEWVKGEGKKRAVRSKQLKKFCRRVDKEMLTEKALLAPES